MTCAKPSPRRRSPRVLLTAAATIALCLAADSSTASAQVHNAAGAPDVAHAAHLQDVVWPAPVGTRQPTEADLPPRLRRDEGAIRPGQRKFDRSLTICRDC